MDYLVLKIRETLNKCIEYFKYNENDPYEGMKIMVKLSHATYLFVSESSDDYVSGKRPTKRKLIILILQLCLWIMALKCLFISYYNSRTVLIMTGDFTYLYPNAHILNKFGFLMCATITTAGKKSLLIRTLSLFKKKKINRKY
jgi:hypothetical protein